MAKNDKLDKMSFDELKALLDEELKKYKENDKYRNCWSIRAQCACIDSLRVRVTPLIARMYKDDPTGYKAALKKLPSYNRTKKTEEEKIESFCDSLLKVDVENPEKRIHLGNLYQKDRSR